MQFIQLAVSPGAGIPDSDGYCFGQLQPESYRDGTLKYKFRYHPKSNGNLGGWKCNLAHKTSFKLTLTFEESYGLRNPDPTHSNSYPF